MAGTEPTLLRTVPGYTRLHQETVEAFIKKCSPRP